MTTVGRVVEPCDFCQGQLRPVHGLERHGCARCADCGSVLCVPRPTVADVMKQYQVNDYYTVQYSADELARLAAGHRELARDVRRVVGHGGRVVEVGCGSGSLLAALQREGLEASGIDVSEPAVTRARETFGVDARRALVEEYEFPAKLDAVIGLHFFEHLVRPAAFLVTAREAIRPGGILVLEVPDFGAWTRRRLGERWNHLRPGEHLQHFDEVSLRRVYDRYGFRPFRTQRIGGLGVLDHPEAHPDIVGNHHRPPLPTGLRGRLYEARHMAYRIPGGRRAVRAVNSFVGYQLLHRNSNVRVWARRR